MIKQPSDYYKTIQDALLEEINAVRQDPKSYIPILEEHKRLFQNNVLVRQNQPPIQTYEGPAAFDDAIEFLNEQEAVPALNYSEDLTKAALDLCDDLGPKGLVSHEDSNGNYVSERIEKYTEWDTACFECIDLGGRSAEEVVINLIVDDGVKNRVNRYNLFSQKYKHLGIGTGYHKGYGIFTVLVFVGGIREKGSLYYDYDNYKYPYPETEEKRKIVNDYQINDPDAPNNAVGLRILKDKKEFKGKKVIVTKKCYKLDDGTEHIVEVEEF